MNLPSPKLRNGGIPAEDGAALIRFIKYWRPLEVFADDVLSFRHPFEVIPRWDGGQGRWEVQLFRDSYVAEDEVEAPALSWEEVGRATRERIGDEPDGPVVPWLSEEPWLPVRDWRPIGTDAPPLGPEEVVPEFFEERGVLSRVEASTNGEALTFALRGSPEERANRRLLRGADIVLHKARARARLDVIDEKLVVVFDPPGRRRAWITIQQGSFEGDVVLEGIAEQLVSGLTDSGIDEMRVATVYLLSPQGERDGAVPDERWIPYVEPALWWNVNHDSSRDVNIVEPLDLGFNIPLAGGVAQGAIDSFLDDINLKDAVSSAIVSKARVLGYFWTV